MTDRSDPDRTDRTDRPTDRSAAADGGADRDRRTITLETTGRDAWPRAREALGGVRVSASGRVVRVRVEVDVVDDPDRPRQLPIVSHAFDDVAGDAAEWLEAAASDDGGGDDRGAPADDRGAPADDRDDRERDDAPADDGIRPLSTATAAAATAAGATGRHGRRPDADVHTGARVDDAVEAVTPGTKRAHVLRAIDRSGWLSTAAVTDELAELWGVDVDRSTVSAYLSTDHERGHVERRPRDHGNGYEYRLTDRGRRAVERGAQLRR